NPRFNCDWSSDVCSSDLPKMLPNDIEASPVLADLNGDNRNDLIVANSDGVIHAWQRDGSELPGWPVHTDEIGAMHDDSPAVSSRSEERRVGQEVKGWVRK